MEAATSFSAGIDGVQDYMYSLVDQPPSRSVIHQFTKDSLQGYSEPLQDNIRMQIARQLPKMKHARNTAVAELPAEQKAALQAEATRSIKAKSDKKRKEERKQLLDNAWGSRRAWCRAE
ncbi:hypothetical protein Ct61P_15500 [Colletotrichum tofieldiae]|nr:hypothetical protein Ct61P_15500 [Colletotrichum tofieldiae]